MSGIQFCYCFATIGNFSTFVAYIKSMLIRNTERTMRKFLQGIVIPFTLFSFIIVMIGCDPSLKNKLEEQQSHQDASETNPIEHESNIKDFQEKTVEDDQSDLSSENKPTSSLAQHKSESELKSGNVFYIARDVASMQMNAGDYVTEIQKTQDALQSALDHKDQKLLQTTATNLHKQLTNFNQALINLDLKSQEIHNIRENIVSANKQVLKSSLMNGDLDYSKVDFKKIESQMSSVQNEMLKLASMILPKNTIKEES